MDTLGDGKRKKDLFEKFSIQTVKHYHNARIYVRS